MQQMISRLFILALLTGLMSAPSLAQSSQPAPDPGTGDAPPAEAPEPPRVTIGRAAICRGIADREPAEPAAQFTVGDERAYTWCEVLNGAGSTIEHAYYHNGDLADSVTLQIRSDRFRTWSYKTLRPGTEGTWRVDLVQGDTVLFSLDFQVDPAPAERE